MINTKGKKTDLRCNNCAKKLAEGEAVSLSIKCPRCGHVNEFSNAPRERGVCELLAHNPEH